jgi:hypothetical protein
MQGGRTRTRESAKAYAQWQRQRQRQQRGEHGRGDERAQGVRTEPQGQYKRERASTRRVRGVRTSAGGFERAQGVRTEPRERYKRERASTRGGRGSSNEHMGYERSTGDGTNEHEASAGSANERRRIHRTPRKTLPDLISPRVWISLSQIVWRRCGNFSTTSLFIHT